MTADVRDFDVDYDQPRVLTVNRGRGDRIFRGIARTSGGTVLLIISLIGLFLSVRAALALRKAGFSFITTAAWDPDANNFGIAAVLLGTIFVALVALVVAIPLSLGMALYISEYAPARLKNGLRSVVDLAAAVPSIVYGIWGFWVMQRHMGEVARWISTYFSWIPIFKVDNVDPRNPLFNETAYQSSTLIAGIAVGLMVTPIACSVMREVFSQAPPGEREGALALGATRWGMIRAVVLPFGKGGIIGGIMLGLGRALGETIAVLMILAQIFVIQPHILQNGGSSVAALIAQRFGASSAFGLSALMAAGLALFFMTMIINFGAASIVAKSRSGASTGA